MKFLGSCLSVACIFLLVGEIHAQQNLATPPARTGAIPFQLVGGFLIEVEGGIGHLEGLKFILDTGASYSVVDQRIADRFSAARRSEKIFNFDRFVSVDRMEFPDVHFGPVAVHNVSMRVAELAKLSNLIPDADAIIGLDLLKTASELDILYDSNMVLLIPRSAITEDTSERERSKCLTVQVILQDHPIELIFDTGLEGLLLYEDRIRKHVPHLRLADVRKNAHEGRLRGKIARLPGLRLGGPESDAEVFLIPGPRADLAPEIDGVLGTVPLKANRIEVDFAGKALRWK
jgi:gag-polyprotein putative aspartyl protease